MSNPPAADASHDLSGNLPQDSLETGTLSIAVVSSETGVPAHLLRKWEDHYGFPSPLRNSQGVRRYPVTQVHTLREIKRLVDLGKRPGEAIRACVHQRYELVRQQPAEPVDAWTSTASDPVSLPVTARDGVVAQCLRAVQAMDAEGLHRLLDRSLVSLGAQHFIGLTVAPLTEAIGECWVAGNIRPHQEHLFSDTLEAVLFDLHLRLQLPFGQPRVLLCTPPGERHTLGLSMLRAVLADAGAHCVWLGSEVPVADVAEAVLAHRIDIVAVSISPAYRQRLAAQTLEELRRLVPAPVPVWLGGAGAAELVAVPPGVKRFDSALDAMAELRRSEPQAPTLAP